MEEPRCNVRNRVEKPPRHFVAYVRRPLPLDHPRATAQRDVERLCRHATAHDLVLELIAIEHSDRYTLPMEQRQDGRTLLARLDEGDIAGVLLTSLDSAFSSVREAIETLDRWLAVGLSVHVLRFYDNGASLRLDQPDRLHMAFSRWISTWASLQRRMDAQARAYGTQKRRDGGWVGRPPYGFRVEQGRLVEDADRIRRILAMKRARRRGRSYREIARAFGVSPSVVHRLVHTDLRLLKRMGRRAEARRDTTPMRKGR